MNYIELNLHPVCLSRRFRILLKTYYIHISFLYVRRKLKLKVKAQERKPILMDKRSRFIFAVYEEDLNFNYLINFLFLSTVS